MLSHRVDGEGLERVELLLATGANVDAAEGQARSALHRASEKGSFVIVKTLLDAGADVNATSYTGETVIQAAEKGGNRDVLKLLQMRQAQIVAKAPTVTEKTEESFQLSTNRRRRSLCSTWSRLPLEVFTPGLGDDGFEWHPSLTAL